MHQQLERVWRFGDAWSPRQSEAAARRENMSEVFGTCRALAVSNRERVVRRRLREENCFSGHVNHQCDGCSPERAANAEGHEAGWHRTPGFRLVDRGEAK